MADAITKYRISSNEVIKISVMTPPQTFDDRDTDFFGVLVDPSYPDGTSIFDPDDEPPVGRKLGFAKWADVGGDIVRNATQAEIDTWAAAELDDDNQEDVNRAEFSFFDNSQSRKLHISALDVNKDENNILRRRLQDIKDAAIASANYTAFRAALSAHDELSGRTLEQYKDQVRTRISNSKNE